MDDAHKMPFGKYKGQSIENIDLEYLRWLVENGRAGRMKQPILDLIASRGNKPPVEKPIEHAKKPKQNRDLSQYDDSKTHYDWTDRNGKTHRIPNDVSLQGTEHEEPPFDATPAYEFEELSDLDREFRLIVA